MSQTEELFLLAGTWTLIAVFIARLISNWPGRIAFLVIAIGLPFWELPYGYYNFQNLCREEAGVKSIAAFPPQDSVCINSFDLGLYNQLAKAGFSRIEIVGPSGNAQEHAAKGEVFITDRKRAKSSYCIFFQGNITLRWGISRSDKLIVRLADNFSVSRQSDYSWSGMWWQYATRPVFGFGGECFGSRSAIISTLQRGSN